MTWEPGECAVVMPAHIIVGGETMLPRSMYGVLHGDDPDCLRGLRCHISGPQTLKLKAAVKQWLEGKAKPPESPLRPGPWTLGPEPHWKHCRQQERPRAIGCPTASVGAQSPGAPHLQPGWRRFPGTIESNRSASPHYHDRLAGSNAPFEVWGHGDLQQVASAAPLISPAAQRKTCIHCSTRQQHSLGDGTTGTARRPPWPACNAAFWAMETPFS